MNKSSFVLLLILAAGTINNQTQATSSSVEGVNANVQFVALYSVEMPTHQANSPYANSVSQPANPGKRALMNSRQKSADLEKMTEYYNPNSFEALDLSGYQPRLYQQPLADTGFANPVPQDTVASNEPPSLLARILNFLLVWTIISIIFTPFALKMRLV